MDMFKFFGRRKGRKIRKAKTSLLERFLPQVKVKQGEKIAPEMFGAKVEKMCLEIGFGGGEHLAGVSLMYKDTGFVGAEVFQNGVANLLSLMTGIKQNSEVEQTIKLLPKRVDNVRIYDDDVRELFALVEDDTFDMVYLLFPDPWPKNRHASRRFVNPDNIKELARIIKKGGKLLIATDHPIYKRWVLRQMSGSKFFEWTAKCGNDWRYPPADWVETKYQQKAIREGRRPVFFEYKRV